MRTTDLWCSDDGVSYESLKSLFRRPCRCRQVPTFAALVQAEAHRRRACLGGADVRRAAAIVVVEVRYTGAGIVAGAAGSELVAAAGAARGAVARRIKRGAKDAVRVGCAHLAVVEVVAEIVIRAGVAEHFPVRLPDLEDVVARHGVGDRLATPRAADGTARAQWEATA